MKGKLVFIGVFILLMAMPVSAEKEIIDLQDKTYCKFVSFELGDYCRTEVDINELDLNKDGKNLIKGLTNDNHKQYLSALNDTVTSFNVNVVEEKLIIDGYIKQASQNYWLLEFEDFILDPWWNATFGYRYAIINNETSIEYPLAVNDTYGIDGSPIWALIKNESFIYSTASGPSGTIAIANETAEKKWENATSETGNNITDIWGATAMGIFHMEDVSGTLHDSSSQSNDAVASSLVYGNEGLFGKALYFADDTIRTGAVPNEADFDVTTGYTIEATVNLTGTSNYRFITAKSTGAGQGGWELMTHASYGGGNFILEANDGNWDICDSGILPVLGQYYHLVAQRNTTHMWLYVNGTKTCTAANTLINNNDAVWIAQRTGSSTADYQWIGEIDELHIYIDDIKTGAWIQARYWNFLNNQTRLGIEEEAPAPPTIDTIKAPVVVCFSIKPVCVKLDDSTIYYFENINTNGNMHVSLNLPVSYPFIFAHTNNTIPVAIAGTWYNVTFDEEESLSSKITHTYDDATNDTFTIIEDGYYDIHYAMSFADDQATPLNHIVMRVVRNGTELKGSLLEEDSTKQYSDFTISNGPITYLTTGDKIKFQFTSDSDTVSLTSHRTYGVHHDTAVVKIKRIA